MRTHLADPVLSVSASREPGDYCRVRRWTLFPPMSMDRRVNVPLLSLILMGRNVTVIVLGWEKLMERPDQIVQFVAQ